jgi:hypothetical protein
MNGDRRWVPSGRAGGGATSLAGFHFEGHDMNFRLRSSALAIATALSFPFAGAVFAQTVTVTDVTVSGSDGFTISVPSIEATGSSLDEAGIRALFGTDYASTFMNLATLDAASLKIPTVTVTYEVPALDGSSTKSTETIIYSDFEMTGVEDGVAKGGARIGNVEILGAGTRLTVGGMTASYLDLGGILNFYGLAGTDRPANDAMIPIYRDFAMADMVLSGPGLSCTVGPAVAAEFSARPLKYSFADLMTKTAALEAAQTAKTEPSTDDIIWLVNFYADFLTAFTSTPSTLDGMNCTVEDPIEARTYAFTAGDVTIGGFEVGTYPSISVDDFNFEVPSEGFFKFGNFTWKQTDFAPSIAAIKDAGAALDLAWFETNWRKLIPAFDGVSFADVSFDIPDEQNKDERIVGGIGGFDITLASYVNGIPSNISASTKGLTFALPDTADMAPLKAIGIETLDLGADIKARWDEATRTIAVENIALSGVDLGSLAISGTIANAGAELFSEDDKVALAASMTLTVTNVKIDIQNGGIAPALIAAAAAEQKLDPAAFHVQLAAMSRALPMGILGATQEALQVGEALGSFLEGTPNLTITLTSVDPNGLGLAEFMAAQQNPEALKGKFTIVAEANGEKVPFVFPEIAAPAATPPAPETPATTEAPAADAAPAVIAPPTEVSPRAGEKQGGKN